jgi:apolipoprotein N-acyltransferase
VFPGAEFLVLPGLMAEYALATLAARPLRWLYLQQLLRFLWFSASLAWVMWPGYLGVSLVGPLYLVVAVALVRPWLRAGSPWARGVTFALVVAVAEMLRATAPEIPYPHGQPIHALAFWPGLLGPVRLAGQPFGNLLLALAAAGLVELVRDLRARGIDDERAPRVGMAGLVAAVWLASIVFAAALAPRDPSLSSGPPVLAVQTGIESALWIDEGAVAERRARIRRDLLAATEAAAGPGVVDPPALVLWPEGAWWFTFEGREGPQSTPMPVRLHEGTTLLAQGFWTERASDPFYRAVIALIDHRGLVLGWQEKIHPVPVGERPPLVEWLPESWRNAVVDYADEMLGRVGYRYLAAGEPRPALELPVIGRVGGLVCYDNAFVSTCRERVAGGAEFLCVLSDESWYRGGAELDQLLALTVCHAIETKTPIVRASVDGVTCLVDAEGEVHGALPRGVPGTLELEVPLGPGRLPALAWLPPATATALLVAFVLLAASRFAIRGILRRSGTWPPPSIRPLGGLDES